LTHDDDFGLDVSTQQMRDH